jgi:hypothetical protein
MSEKLKLTMPGGPVEQEEVKKVLKRFVGSYQHSSDHPHGPSGLAFDSDTRGGAGDSGIRAKSPSSLYSSQDG